VFPIYPSVEAATSTSAGDRDDNPPTA
jgi:anti-sigma B factor antagonist